MNINVCKCILKLFVVLACTGIAALPGYGATLTVDDNGNANFTTIQEAVNSSNNGDSILVSPGIYTENIEINKEISLVSSGKSTNTFISSDDTETDVLHVTADNVIIDGFSIIGFMEENRTIDDESRDTSGIFLDGARECSILNSTFLLNDIGILASESNNITLDKNLIALNYFGVGLVNSSGCTLSENIVTRSDSNIVIVDSSDNTLSNNKFTGSHNISVLLDGCSNNLLDGNQISGDPLTGIFLERSENNTLVDNDVEANLEGIFLSNSSNNLIYGNWFDNQINAIDYGTNFWNNTIGNYWSDYEAEDTNMDGVGDKPYIVNESTGSIDYIPIV